MPQGQPQSRDNLGRRDSCPPRPAPNFYCHSRQLTPPPQSPWAARAHGVAGSPPRARACTHEPPQEPLSHPRRLPGAKAAHWEVGSSSNPGKEPEGARICARHWPPTTRSHAVGGDSLRATRLDQCERAQQGPAVPAAGAENAAREQWAPGARQQTRSPSTRERRALTAGPEHATGLPFSSRRAASPASGRGWPPRPLLRGRPHATSPGTRWRSTPDAKRSGGW